MQSFDCGQNYYSIIGVYSDATREEIRQTYYTKARECHPDIGGNPEEMKLLNEAYQVLINPETRKAYDQLRGFNTKGYQSSPFLSNSSDISSEKKIFIKDIRWLVTRAVSCFLLGFICFGYAEDPRHTALIVFPWLLRILGFMFFMLGAQLSFSAHKITQFHVKRKNTAYNRDCFRIYRVLFLAAAIVCAALIIIQPYLS